VLDRLIQQTIAQVLLPIFDPQFSESSLAFRPARSAHAAVYPVREYIRKGPWRLSRKLAIQTGMITPRRDSRIKVS
jgi:retron-type reverse transcriptase